MTARVLVVDDVLSNLRMLEAKLAAEYFEVVTASNGPDALEAVQRTRPDIVLLDVVMPGMDGLEVCRRIKQNPSTQHVPVVMVTALDQPEDRVRGLEAGADDFLSRPVNDAALFCRVKGLVRLKMLTDELRARTGTDPLGLGACDPSLEQASWHIMVIDNRVASGERVRSLLAPRHEVNVVAEPQQAFEALRGRAGGYDLVIVSLDLDGMDGLRICSQLKTEEATRQTPILLLVDPEDHQRLLRGLDMGVNDYLIRPLDPQELLARVATQIRRHRYTEQLRTTVRASMELAVTDPLTGLYNRRYLETQLCQLIEQSDGRGLSLLTLDIDFFKSVNDTYGHDAGDRVLQEVAGRLRAAVRSTDLACRTGGEEFVVVLPGADLAVAEKVGERIRKSIAARSFTIGPNGQLTVTASLGVSTLLSAQDRVEDILKRADRALYRAKREGRNRVIPAAA